MPTPPPASAPAPLAANDTVARPSDSQWADIIQQLGAEIAGPLSAALDRIQALISTGQIDRQGLKTLHDAVAQAREAGMVTQQLARLASGRLQLARERVHLTQVLRGVLTQRSRETQARGIQVRQLLQPLEIWTDGSLLFSLLNAVMDWALANTHSSLELRLDVTPWPPKARLMCRFAHRSLDIGAATAAAATGAPESLDSMTWRLIEQTALRLGVLPLREDEAGITMLTMEFPHIVSDENLSATMPSPAPLSSRGAASRSSAGQSPSQSPITTQPTRSTHPPGMPSGSFAGTASSLSGLSPQGLPQQSQPMPLAPSRRPAAPPPDAEESLSSHPSKPLAGCHLLIVSPRRELRQQIQAAVRHMGLIIDAVSSMPEALAFCEEGLPHGIAFEHALRDADFELLQAHIAAEVPGFSFIEVRETEQQTQLSTATPDRIARIARPNLADALPSVLLFELSKAL